MLGLAIATLLVGALLPLQAGVNVQLRGFTGTAAMASLISFAVGTIVLFAYVIALRANVPSPAALAHAPWWVWIGGVLGAIYVAATVLLAPRLGATLFFALVVAGQMANSLALDHFGAVGFAAHPITLARVLGIVLVIGGVIVIRAF